MKKINAKSIARLPNLGYNYICANSDHLHVRGEKVHECLIFDGLLHIVYPFHSVDVLPSVSCY